MILIDDSFRFISSIRSDDNSVRFCDSAEISFDDKFSPGDDTASFIVIWKFDGDNWWGKNKYDSNKGR
jgi:hypothetical protein